MTKTEVINELVSKCGETLLSVEALRQWLSIVVPDLENLNTVTEGAITDRFAGEVNVKNKESITVADLYDAYVYGTDLTVQEVTQVGESGFQGRRNLISVSLPNATLLGNQAFTWCSSLESIDIPKCRKIGSAAFYDCSSLTTVNAPLCEEVQTYAFYSCSSLETITLPSCTEIKVAAFRDCSSLKSIYLPVDQVVTMYSAANTFGGLPSDYCIYVPESQFNNYLNDSIWSEISSHLRIIGASEVVYTGNIDVDALGNAQQCIIVNGPAPQYTSDKITIVMPETVRLNASTIFVVGDYSSLEDYLNGRDYISHSEATMWQGCRLMNDTSGQLIAGQRYDVVFVISGTDVRFYRGGYDG